MKRIIAGIIIALLFMGCNLKNEVIIQAHKTDSLETLQGKTFSLQGVEFKDWAYPARDQLEKFCSDQPELMPLAYENDKYHGVKLILRDYENMPYEIDESDGSIIYSEAEEFLVIAFFPRRKHNLAKRFKRYYVSKKSLVVRGKCIGVLPEEIWTDIQIQEEDMPVILLKSVF